MKKWEAFITWRCSTTDHNLASGNALTAFVLAVRSGRKPVLDERFSVLDMPLEYLGVRLIDAELIRAARASGRWLNVWTVDDEAEMRSLVGQGIGGIMTDRPDLLRRVLDEAGMSRAGERD